MGMSVKKKKKFIGIGRIKNFTLTKMYYLHHKGLRQLIPGLAGLVQRGNWSNSRKDFKFFNSFLTDLLQDISNTKRVTVCYSNSPKAYFFPNTYCMFCLLMA